MKKTDEKGSRTQQSNGRAIVVTGGTSGIGRELVGRLSRENRLIVVARSAERLADLQARVPGIDARQCDLSDLNAVADVAEAIASAYSSIDVLVNNAALQRLGDFASEDFEPAGIEMEVTVNFTAVCVLCQRLLPALQRSSGEAVILNVGSGLAIAPKASAPIYCATKAALRSFTRSLSYQLEGTQVRVAHVALPLVDTPMTTGRGSGKISATQAVEELIDCIESPDTERFVGKSRLLHLIYRIAPALAYRIIKRS